MARTRRVTANLPEDILQAAMAATGRGITETLIEGLERVRRGRAHQKALALRGKVTLRIDVDQSRERHRR